MDFIGKSYPSMALLFRLVNYYDLPRLWVYYGFNGFHGFSMDLNGFTMGLLLFFRFCRNVFIGRILGY